MRLIVIEDGAMIADVHSERETIYVGSQGDCRVHLPDSRVAPQQAVIYPEKNNTWTLEQLDPEHEVHLNGTTIIGKVQLKTGDEITIYDHLIRVFPEHEDQSVAAPRVEMGTSRAALERFVQNPLPSGSIIKKQEESITVEPEQLGWISRANLALSQCISVEPLMDITLNALLEILAAQRAWIGIRRVNYGPMEYVEGRLVTGHPTDLPEYGERLKPRALDRHQSLLVPQFSADERVSALAAPMIGPDGPLGLVYVDSGETGRSFTTQDLDVIVLLANTVATQLDAIFKDVAKNRAATIDGEVSVAHEIQARVTPRKLPQWEALQFGAFREPGRLHTGDVYDLIRLGNQNAAFMVAHTSATGALPSMLMATAQAAFRYSCMHQDSPHLFMRSLNWLLYDGQNDHPLAAFAGVLNPQTGELKYAMAGKTGAYIIGQRGEERRLGPAEPLAELGLHKSTAYPLLTEQLEPKETVVLFTPGVTTAKNRQEETFGEDRFVNILCDGFGQLASAMLKEMLSDLRNFTAGGSQPDDITVLMAHRVEF